MTLSDFTAKVLLAINEDSGNDKLEKLIKDKSSDAASMMILYAPVNLLQGGETALSIAYPDNATSVECPSGYYCITITKPGDFVRFESASFSTWKRKVFSVKDVNSSDYHTETSSVKGVGSSPYRPSIYDTGSLLESYGVGASQDSGTLNYYGKKTWVNDDLPIPSILEDAVIYFTAYLVEDALGEAEMANRFLETAKSFLGNTGNNG